MHLHAHLLVPDLIPNLCNPLLTIYASLDFARRTRMMRKMEAMIPYWMARCPNYGWKESQEYFNAEDLHEKIGAMEAKAKKRWEANFC